MPKITAADFNYDPMNTPIAHCYKDELSATPGVSGATLIEDGLSAFVIRAAFARMATKTIDLQTYIYGTVVHPTRGSARTNIEAFFNIPNSKSF